MKKCPFHFRVHPAGAVLWVLALLFLPSGQVLAAGLALLWHEGCHLAAMLLCGVRDCSVEITPFGGMADSTEYEKLPPGKQIICALAGVAGSAFGMAACVLWLKPYAFGRMFWQMHLSLAFVNCLPLWPLDGARVWVAAASAFGLENGMRRFLQGLAVLTGMGMSALSLYGAWRGVFNPTLLCCGPYLCYASRQGYRSEQMRRLCCGGGKLNGGRVLPVKFYASRMEESTAAFAPMLGRFSRERYHILLQMEDGRLQRIRTEDEMLHAITQPEEIGRRCK